MRWHKRECRIGHGQRLERLQPPEYRRAVLPDDDIPDQPRPRPGFAPVLVHRRNIAGEQILPPIGQLDKHDLRSRGMARCFHQHHSGGDGFQTLIIEGFEACPLIGPPFERLRKFWMVKLFAGDERAGCHLRPVRAGEYAADMIEMFVGQHDGLRLFKRGINPALCGIIECIDLHRGSGLGVHSGVDDD